MKIELTRTIPFKLTLTIETHNVATHSALSDLSKDNMEMVKTDLNYLLNMIEDLMERRRFDLNKGKG